MANRRPTQGPLAILVVGLITIAIFGGGVWLLSDRTPIVKLRPVLEKTYKTYGFRCWLKLEELRIEVEPPSNLPLDTLARRHLGATALIEYVRLASGRTQVESAVVLGRHGEPPEVVTQAQVDLLQSQDLVAPTVLQRVASAAATSATITLCVPGRGGNALVLDLPAETGEAVARRAATAAASVPGIVFVRVRRGAADPVIEGGAELELFRASPGPGPTPPVGPTPAAPPTPSVGPTPAAPPTPPVGPTPAAPPTPSAGPTPAAPPTPSAAPTPPAHPVPPARTP